MNHNHILGIDISKAKLDIALRLPDGKFRSKVISNMPEGFDTLRNGYSYTKSVQVQALRPLDKVVKDNDTEIRRNIDERACWTAFWSWV